MTPQSDRAPEPDPGEALADEAFEETPAFRLLPLDWSKLEAEGLPGIEYLRKPYLPASARVWAFGGAESGKSLFFLATACVLTRESLGVAFISQENPLAEDVRRLTRLNPDWSFLRFFVDSGLDLAEPEHVTELIRAVDGCVLVILDTLSAVWSGDENDNAAIGALDRDVLARIVRETGATVVVIDHTGHPQAFVRRRGVNAGRGASAKAQKADVVLEFRAEPGGFTIEHAKNRMGGSKAPLQHVAVVDGEDGSLVLNEREGEGPEVAALADKMVELIESSEEIGTRALRAGVGGNKDRQSEAMRFLSGEDPPRVTVASELIDTPGGKQRAKVWRPADQGVLGVPE